jgi:hypothetical protein
VRDRFAVAHFLFVACIFGQEVPGVCFGQIGFAG